MFHNTGGMEGVELIKLKAASTYRMHPVSLLKETHWHETSSLALSQK